MGRRRALRTNLGPALEPVIGRERAVAAVIARLAGGARVVTLTGPGGVGKSALAREVGRRLLAADADAGVAGRGAGASFGVVLVCALADVTDGEGLLAEVTRAVGGSAGAARRTASGPGAQAWAATADRLAALGPLTLVLDDADGVVAGAAALVRACLDTSGALRFVVTSREALRVEGEHVMVVEPLGVDAARALFASRAGGGGGGGGGSGGSEASEEPTSAGWSKEQVARLVEHLDGLPLGIELAARRSRLVPPGELLDRLEERFRLLKTDRRDVAARHATLSATIEWSLARLDADEARAFTALGVFEGSFAVEAFESVVGPLLAGDAIDVLEALLRKSLLVLVDSRGGARLTMLRTLRAFARERLAAGAGARAGAGIDATERAALEQRHAVTHVERAESWASRAYGPRADEALDAIAVELPNLLRAFEREKHGARAELAARAIVAIGDVVVLRHAVELRSPSFAEARAAADACGDAGLRARARLVEAKAKLEVAGAGEAEPLLVEALVIAEAANDARVAADVKRSLGWARTAMGEAESALVLFEEALAVHRAQKDVRGEADALAARGLTRCLRGELAEGHVDLENAHALHVLAGDELRREKVEEMAMMVGLQLAGEQEAASLDERIARLRAEADAYAASGRSWREAVARHRLALLEGAPPLALDVGSPAVAARARWLVGPEARWLQPPSGDRVDLARHGSLRRVLDALVSKRIASPGEAMPASSVLEAGWPGEKVRHDSGMLRVYTAVRRLRAMSLGDALLTRDDGYLLSPSVAFDRAS